MVTLIAITLLSVNSDCDHWDAFIDYWDTETLYISTREHWNNMPYPQDLIELTLDLNDRHLTGLCHMFDNAFMKKSLDRCFEIALSIRDTMIIRLCQCRDGCTAYDK